MSEKISFFQRAWGILHFILCLIVVGLLLVYLTREFRHGEPPLEATDTNSQISDSPVNIEAPAVSVHSDAPVDLTVPAITVNSDTPIVLDVPAVSIVSIAPVVFEALGGVERPTFPEVPAMPERPAFSEMLAIPEKPAVPKKPAVSEMSFILDVDVIGPKIIGVHPNSPVFHELDFVAVKQVEITDPIATVIGVNVASLQQSKSGDLEDILAGIDNLHDFKFHTPELLTAFTNRQKAVDDIAIAEMQLQLIKDHYKTAIDTLKQKVDFIEEEVKSGTETQNNLNAAKTELSQLEFEQQKETLTAQAVLQHAQRDKTMFEKQLELAGFQSELLVSTASEIDILMAEVPESTITHTMVGQKCVARFFNDAGKEFNGQVHSILPILSNEIRSFRILFAIEDTDDELHTGMFAEIRLCIDPRHVLRIPPDAVVSINDVAYVLVQYGDAEDPVLNVTEVQTGELHETGIEVISGLEDGSRIVGKGARLLRPAITESLRLQ